MRLNRNWTVRNEVSQRRGSYLLLFLHAPMFHNKDKKGHYYNNMILWVWVWSWKWIIFTYMYFDGTWILSNTVKYAVGIYIQTTCIWTLQKSETHIYKMWNSRILKDIENLDLFYVHNIQIVLKHTGIQFNYTDLMRKTFYVVCEVKKNNDDDNATRK